MEKFAHFPVKDKLHTDILEQKYGKIHAIVLRHDDVKETEKGKDRIREAKLVDAKNILRTYALTFLTYDKGNEEISSIDSEIREGGLIGETFRKHGYIVKKNVIDVFLIDLPQWIQKEFETDDRQSKARLTEFYAKRDSSTPLIYGTVLEIYTPDFRDPKEGINEIDTDQINPPAGTLQSVGVPADEIWERLDRAGEKNEWEDLQERYGQARNLSKPILESLHQKIKNYINNK